VSAWSANTSSSYVEGQTAVLLCQSDSHGDVRLAWMKDGQPLRHNDDGWSTLTVSHVTSTDAGDYVCVATRDDETVTSAAITVSVTGLVSSHTKEILLK